RPRSARWVSALRQAHDGDEEVVDLADDLNELIEVDRLGDVGVGVQTVATHYVLLRLGGGEHDHGDVGELVVALDLLEDFAAGRWGRVEVGQEQGGAGSVGELLLTA